MKLVLCKDCGKEVKKRTAIRCRACEDRHRKIYPTSYCIDCGKKIKLHHTRCLSCYNSYKWTLPYWKDTVSKKISKTLTGRVRPECEKEKIRKTIKEKVANGTHKVSSFKNEQHYNWQGGISKQEYGEDFNKQLKEYIKKRDSYECHNCGSRKSIVVHHIDYNKRNNSELNLITVCSICNIKANYNRLHWKEYYDMLISLIYQESSDGTCTL